MKKLYSAPSLELLAYYSLVPISAETGGDLPEDLMGPDDSNAWNSGELGWS